MTIDKKKASLILLLLFIYGFVYADESSRESLEHTETQTSSSAIDRRMILERSTHDNPFVITPHKPNYALVTYAESPNQAPFDEFNHDLQKAEIKFQFSVKIPLAREVFNDNGYLFVAYTQKAFWQMFNSDLSAPFRDTNHEPELFLSFVTKQPFLGMTNRLISFGINHQSNGRSGTQSRSWNRLYAEFIFEKDHFYLSLKPWWRIPEEEKSDAQDTTGDDNPDITDYMGYGEVIGLYELKRHRLGFMLRNLFSDPYRGAVQLDWSLPLKNKVRGYVQYYNGYGETLLDYNFYSNRIGVGVMLIDWL
ncbi:phospholipase A [Kaarinaea lacus]